MYDSVFANERERNIVHVYNKKMIVSLPFFFFTNRYVESRSSDGPITIFFSAAVGIGFPIYFVKNE